MNSIQITALQPAFNVFNMQQPPSRLCVASPQHNSLKLVSGSSKYQFFRLKRSSLKLNPAPRHPTHVCLSGRSNSGFNPWESFKKVMGDLGEKLSPSDAALDEKMKRLERYDDGGDGSDGGGGGRGGRGGGRPEDDRGGVPDSPDEPLQKIAAILGLIFLYNCILDSQATFAMIMDVLKLMIGLGPSRRLKRMASDFEDMIELAKPDEKIDDPYWLEKEILETPTWWHVPTEGAISSSLNDLSDDSSMVSSEYIKLLNKVKNMSVKNEDDQVEDDQVEDENAIASEEEIKSLLESVEDSDNEDDKDVN